MRNQGFPGLHCLLLLFVSLNYAHVNFVASQISFNLILDWLETDENVHKLTICEYCEY